MRVVLVTSSYPINDDDAAGHFVRAEARALAGRGHQVTVLAPSPSRRAPTLRPDKVSVVWLPGSGAFGWPGVLPRLRRRPWAAIGVLRFVVAARAWLARHSFDRVVAHWLIPAGVPLSSSLQHVDRECVVHGSDARLLLRLPKAVQHAVLRAVLGNGGRVRFVSAELRDRVVRAADRLGDDTVADALRSRSSVAPCPIEVPDCSRASARAALGLDATLRVAIVVSRLLPEKRVARALRQAPLEPPFRWYVIGDGPEQGELEQEFPKVEFLGKLARSETLRWIAAADVLVSASAAEGAPTAVREARALGTAVLSSNVGDIAAWARTDPGITLMDTDDEPSREI